MNKKEYLPIFISMEPFEEDCIMTSPPDPDVDGVLDFQDDWLD